MATRKFKRTKAADVDAWRAARARGLRNSEIADLFDVDVKTIWNHIGPDSAPRQDAPGDDAPDEEPLEDVDASDGLLEGGTGDAPMGGEEFGVWLGGQLRRAQRLANAARARGDEAGEARAMRLASQLAAVMGRVVARTGDDEGTVRVKATEVQAAADRAWAGLEATAAAVVGDVERWRAGGCAGRVFGTSGGRSPVRALFERVALGVLGEVG